MGIKFLFLFVSSVKWSITRAHIFSCFLSSALSLSFISMAYISAGVSAGMQTILSSRYLIATSEETHVLYENVFKAVCSAQISHPSPALLTTSMKYNKYQALMWHMMRVLIPILDLEFFHFFFSLFLPLLPVNATQPDRRKSGSESRLFFFFFSFLQARWLAVCVTPGATLHQSPKTVFFFSSSSPFCMNVRGFGARLLEMLWGNPVRQFWHLISIKTLVSVQILARATLEVFFCDRGGVKRPKS